MNKQVFLSILILIFALVFCGAVSAVENQFVTLKVGEDIELTNPEDFWTLDYDSATQSPEYPDLPAPSDAESYAEGNSARVSISADANESGYIMAENGIKINWDTGEKTWDEVKDIPLRVTVDYSYRISANFDTTGSSYSVLHVVPFLSSEYWGDDGPNTHVEDVGGYEGSGYSSAHRIDVFDKAKNGGILTAANLNYVILVLFVGAHANEYAINPNTASGEVSLNSIQIDFLPVADAGIDQVVFRGVDVVLNGSGSFDPDGNSLIYQWNIVSQPSTPTFDNTNTISPSFSASELGTYIIQLVVTDEHGLTGTDTVAIQVVNQIPIANAGPDQVVWVGSTVELDGSESEDPDDDDLTYLWQFISGPSAVTVSYTETTSFFASQPGDYVFSLTVRDENGGVSILDTVTIHVIGPSRKSVKKEVPVPNPHDNNDVLPRPGWENPGLPTPPGFPFPVPRGLI